MVENFLRLTDKASFEKFKANYKPTGKVIPFKKVCNLKGSVVVASDKKTNNFLTRSQKYFEQVQPLVKR